MGVECEPGAPQTQAIPRCPGAIGASASQSRGQCGGESYSLPRDPREDQRLSRRQDTFVEHALTESPHGSCRQTSAWQMASVAG